MPGKWKLFRVTNYVQLILTSLMLAVSVLGYVKSDPELFDWTHLFFLGLIIIIVNNFFNLHLLSHHYPDKLVTGPKSKACTVLLILSILVNLCLLAILVFGLLSELSHGIRDKGYWMALGLFAFEVVAGIYILVVQ